MSNQATLKDTLNATFSPGSADGASPHESQDGQKIDRSGQALAPVSRSRSREKAAVLTTLGICGPTSFASSVPAGPLSSWESRLRERLAMVGSTELALIWREKVTPAGRLMSRLAPWTPPISEAGCGGSRATWPTITTLDAADRPGMRPSRAATGRTGGYISEFIAELGNMGSWSTPRASDGEKGGPNQSFGAGGQPLPAQMHQATWPTPTARDHFPPHTPEYIAKHKANGHGMSNLNDSMSLTATWPTPKASAAGETSRSGDRKDEPLMGGLMRGATWATPSARDWKDSAGMSLEREDGRTRIDLVPHQMIATARSGQEPDGSPATTEKRGAPNPAFPCWLMGYPAVWLLGAVSATPSSRKSRRK
jgi:hypothetical protein